MSSLLLTLPNLPFRKTTGLLHVDSRTGEKRIVPLGVEEGVLSATGMAAADGRLYVFLWVGGEDFRVAVLDAWSLEPLALIPLPEARDTHSAVCRSGHLYYVSSGNDSVFRRRMLAEGLDAPELVWSVGGGKVDTQHLNAIAFRGDELLVSGFGEKVGGSWKDSSAGFIHSVSRGERLASALGHPHSLLVVGEEVYYCESREGRVVSLSGWSRSVDGYARGLALDEDGRLAVATSRRRLTSKSAAVGVARDWSGATTLRLLDRATAAEKALDLSAFGPEVYDILPWEAAPTGSIPVSWAVEAEFLLQERSIGRLVGELEERSRWAESAAAGIDQRDETIRSLQKALEEQTQWAQDSAKQLRDRDGGIAELQRTVKEMADWGKKGAEALADRDRTIVGLQKALEEQAAWAQAEARALAEKDALIARLQAELKGKAGPEPDPGPAGV